MTVLEIGFEIPGLITLWLEPSIVWLYSFNLSEILQLSGQSPGTSSTISYSPFLHPWRKWLRKVSDNQTDLFPSLSVPVNWAATWQCHYLQLPLVNQTLKCLSDFPHSSQVSLFFPLFYYVLNERHLIFASNEMYTQRFSKSHSNDKTKKKNWIKKKNM